MQNHLSAPLHGIYSHVTLSSHTGKLSCVADIYKRQRSLHLKQLVLVEYRDILRCLSLGMRTALIHPASFCVQHLSGQKKDIERPKT